ncbi:MAG: hypothetical protein O7F12_15785 [Nitrospirae bacterium]|nr:hypothetical protein [Nitrospirota bacterium]
METRQRFREKWLRVYEYLDEGITVIFGTMIFGTLALIFYGVILLLFYAVVLIVFREAFGIDLPNPFFWLK